MPITKENNQSITVSIDENRAIYLFINKDNSLTLLLRTWSMLESEIADFLESGGLVAMRKLGALSVSDLVTDFIISQDLDEALEHLQYYKPLKSADYEALKNKFHKLVSSPTLKKSEKKLNSVEQEASKKFTLGLAELTQQLSAIETLITKIKSSLAKSPILLGDKEFSVLFTAQSIQNRVEDFYKYGSVHARKEFFKLQKKFNTLVHEYSALEYTNKLLQKRSEKTIQVKVSPSKDPQKGLLDLRINHINSVISELEEATKKLFSLPFSTIKDALTPSTFETNLGWVRVYGLKDGTPEEIIHRQLQEARNKVAEYSLLYETFEHLSVLKNEGIDINFITSLLRTQSSSSSNSVVSQMEVAGGNPLISAKTVSNIQTSQDAFITPKL